MLGKSGSFVAHREGDTFARQRATFTGHREVPDHEPLQNEVTRVNTPEDHGTLGVVSATSFALNMCSECLVCRTIVWYTEACADSLNISVISMKSGERVANCAFGCCGAWNHSRTFWYDLRLVCISLDIACSSRGLFAKFSPLTFNPRLSHRVVCVAGQHDE